MFTTALPLSFFKYNILKDILTDLLLFRRHTPDVQDMG